jgi:formylglycine-generating enzyme required for sulfatase activity
MFETSEIVGRFRELLDPNTLRTRDDAEFMKMLADIKQFLPSLPTKIIVDLSTKHPEWLVRQACVEALGPRAEAEPEARRAIAAATHDPVDWVSFVAIGLCGQHRIREAIDDLIKIVGWPSHFTTPGFKRKPVGCGAAFTKKALLEIFGSRDPVELDKLEEAHLEPHYGVLDKHVRQPDLSCAVHVPGGSFQAGGPPAEDAFQMDSGDNEPRTETLDEFWIDRETVTNARYRQFLDAVGTSKVYAHLDEPPNKDYTPAHWRDPRFNRPELPVVGLDWYDCFAFANWAGGMLPSELEWEKAARGTEGRIFPWGNEWEPERANWVGRSLGAQATNLTELEAVLVTVSPTFPAEPVLPSAALPQGASPYGCLQMSGNVWEMTRTNFYSRQDMDPFYKNRHYIDFMNRYDALFVIRGGAWTSPSICLRTYYRGKDLLTDRHNEIGFRCVYKPQEFGKHRRDDNGNATLSD